MKISNKQLFKTVFVYKIVFATTGKNADSRAQKTLTECLGGDPCKLENKSETTDCTILQEKKLKLVKIEFKLIKTQKLSFNYISTMRLGNAGILRNMKVLKCESDI